MVKSSADALGCFQTLCFNTAEVARIQYSLLLAAPLCSVGRSDGLGGFLVVKVALSFSVFLAVLVAECMYSVFLFVLFGYVVSAAYSSTR